VRIEAAMRVACGLLLAALLCAPRLPGLSVEADTAPHRFSDRRQRRRRGPDRRAEDERRVRPAGSFGERTGAGSIIANEHVAKSAADGYTLLVVSAPS